MYCEELICMHIIMAGKQDNVLCEWKQCPLPNCVSSLTIKWHKICSMPIKSLGLFYLLSVSSWNNKMVRVQSYQEKEISLITHTIQIRWIVSHSMIYILLIHRRKLSQIKITPNNNFNTWATVLHIETIFF